MHLGDIPPLGNNLTPKLRPPLSDLSVSPAPGAFFLVGRSPPSVSERAAISDLVRQLPTAFDPDNLLMLGSLCLNKVFQTKKFD